MAAGALSILVLLAVSGLWAARWRGRSARSTALRLEEARALVRELASLLERGLTIARSNPYYGGGPYADLSQHVG